MKRLLLSALVMTMLMPTVCMAQTDDVYFVPSKKEKTEKAPKTVKERPMVYSVGTTRDVDEYNRRHYRSSYVRIQDDSIGDDIIDFEGVENVPDTLYLYEDEYGCDPYDYYYSRLMSRFDDFYGWYPYYYRTRMYWDYPYWRGPYWSYSSFWYDPWYDPWSYSWYGYGWSWYPYSYYHGWYGGYHRPLIAWGGHSGTRNHGHVNRHGTALDRDNTRFGTHDAMTSRPITVGTFGTRRPNTSTTDMDRRGSNGRFGGSRSTTDVRVQRNDVDRPESFGNSRSYGSENRSVDHSYGSSRSGSFNSGGSFGGSRSGGGSFGGGSRVGGGGGHFGGRR